MLTKLATFRGVSPSGEPLSRVFHPGDSIIKVAGDMMPQIRNWLSAYKPQANQLAVLVNAMGSSEYWGQNVNGDLFPENALVHDCRNHPAEQHPYDEFTGKIVPPYGYWTFLQALPFVHHRNKDPNRAFGKVVLSAWNPRMHRVELVIILDKALALQHGAQHVVDRILAGEFPDVSMGCKVPYDVCTICGHKSKTRQDYCNCIRYIGMGKILDDGRRIGVINIHPRFFDISFVFIGADKTAKVMCKLGSENSRGDIWLPQSVQDADLIYKTACGAKDCRDCQGGCKVKAASRRGDIVDFYTGRRADAPGNVDQRDVVMKHYGEKAAMDEEEARRILLELGGAKKPYTTGPLDMPNNLSFVVDKEMKNLAKKAPVPRMYFGREDDQEREGKRAIEDGTLRTNANTNECDEFPKPLYPGRGAVKSASGLNDVFAKAKELKISEPPSPNRKEYPFVGTINFKGIQIGVECAPGTWRTGKGWKTLMKLPYGEFLANAMGADKDKLDVYVGPYLDAPNVYIVHQNRVDTGKYDEDKVMLGLRSPEEAKAAYLAHYDSDKFFRSITTMAFPLFKRALLREEFEGDKVATVKQLLEKDAEDLRLEDLFEGHKLARRRERTWRNEVSGQEVNVKGSGLNKTASIRKISAPTPHDILKISAEKWADIVKEVGPEKAVGKVSPLLSAGEPSLPTELLNEMGAQGTERALSTPSTMGMVLKPEEFQRILLTAMGEHGMADDLDGQNAVFAPQSEEAAPCRPLESDQASKQLMSALMPFLRDKSYYGPVVRHRIIQVIMRKPQEQAPKKEVTSPLLSKVGAAYTWYRREQMKLAGDAMRFVPGVPALHAGLYGLDDAAIFDKTAAWLSPKTMAVILGAIPLTLMYSAHQRRQEGKGEELNLVNQLIADHPWLATLATSAALREVLKTPQGQAAVDEMLAAGQRVWKGQTRPEL